MNSRIVISLLALPLAALPLLLGAGCTAYGVSRAEQEASEREDSLLLREDIRRLQGRVEGLEMQNESLRNELELLRSETSRVAGNEIDSLQRRVTEVQSRIEQLESARQRDKQEIVDTLSGTISKVMKSSPPAGSSGGTAKRSSQKASSGYGYEHTVESGQTLSAIANAYGTTTSAILDANDLKDPNTLRVGQVLFIPE